MLYIIIRWIINAVLLMIIPYFVGGFEVANFYVALVSALVLAFINAIIRPILIILTLPINILTLGLFTLVLNALIFWFIASFVRGFSVIGFWSAFWAALVYSIFSMILNYFVNQKSDQVKVVNSK